MRKVLLLLGMGLWTIHMGFAQGWRPQEQQVLIEINSESDTQLIRDMKISLDVVSANLIRAYLIPKELDQISSSGLIYEIEINDLNQHSKELQFAEDSWHSYQDIIDLADSLEQEFPSICKKYIFGTSLGGRQCAALKISDNVAVDEPEAELMFDGGIHGDEYPGAENVIRFARYLCVEYGNDPNITNLVDNRETWLYLMVNPDGRVNVSRYNNNNVDLNRDWAYMWDAWGSSTGPCSQIESKALRECMYNNQFVVHTTYHAGTEYVSLPWSYRSSQPADWNHIYQLGSIYSSTSLYPNLDFGQGNTGMYAINGSTKDSNYGMMGSISWSMEISNSKIPPTSQIQLYYNRNVPAMLAMMEYAGYGLQGIITDANTGLPVEAIVFVNDYFPVYSDATAGDFHKYVLPGTYNISVMANGYQIQTINNVLVAPNSSTPTNFQLQPATGQYAFKVAACQIPGNNEADEGWTPGALGAPDNINYSIGKNGWIVVDMQSPISDGPGYDLTVFEGDSSPETFICYAGISMDGPWINLGTGNGTSSFDLSGSGLINPQYIKILDDGDGLSTANNAGFDLDAIAVTEPVTGTFLILDNYSIDDSFGNNNGKIDPGESVNILVSIQNIGDLSAENSEINLSTVSPYITILSNTASLGTILPGETGTGSIPVLASSGSPIGESALFDLSVSANSGAYTSNFNLNFVIGQINIAILDLDENNSSGPSIKTSIENNGLLVDYFASFQSNISQYDALFVCLGVYTQNHVLTSSEGQVLANFLNAGGNLYMEGADTWFYDPQTAVHPMFNILGNADGSADLQDILGIAGTFTEGMSFSYSGDNNWIDRISAQNSAELIFVNQSPSYGTGVIFDGGTYKTIGVSHEFGGLDNGVSPSTQTELMEKYLDYFGMFPEPPTNTILQVSCLLEGPYFGGEMSNGLNLFGMLPLNQPYDVEPWFYSGTENVESIPHTNIVDWVLVELRETAGDVLSAIPITKVGMQAGFILKNGQIVSTDGVSPLNFNLDITANLFVIIYHRNHTAIISALPVSHSNEVYSIDFSSSGDMAFGGSNGQKEIAPGLWAMFSGDGNADGEINNLDKDDIWINHFGNAGYFSGDFNLNGQVDQIDLNFQWQSNSGKTSYIIK
ncbi:MAG: hypothetical protein K9G76_08485 [Bacteroidales bacterium]|nr:hypothetical protein [Bacteroidales bacterium]MCF8403477.1 hypothetical protein [Bacteroidales bacterium]